MLASTAALFAGKPLTVRLYPNGAPDSNGVTEEEYVNEKGSTYNTTDPRIDVYLPEGGENMTMLLVCPGGGYAYASTENEGINVAKFFTVRGIAIAVLKYRMPNAHCTIPLEDAQMAMKIIRDNAAEWHINPKQIGVMGFSAGGHLASTVVTKFSDKVNRPDFGILIYPVISMDVNVTHGRSRTNLLGENPTVEQEQEWSSEKFVKADTPPCFLAACSDDPTVAVKNSLLMYEALVENKVSVEMHIFPTGGHGWGFSREFNGRDQFESALLSWIANRN